MFAGSPAVSPASNPSADGPARKRQLLLCHITALLWYTSIVLQAMPPFHDSNILCAFIVDRRDDTSVSAGPWHPYAAAGKRGGGRQAGPLSYLGDRFIQWNHGNVAHAHKMWNIYEAQERRRHAATKIFCTPSRFHPTRIQVLVLPMLSYCRAAACSALRKLIDAPPTSPGTGKF